MTQLSSDPSEKHGVEGVIMHAEGIFTGRVEWCMDRGVQEVSLMKLPFTNVSMMSLSRR